MHDNETHFKSDSRLLENKLASKEAELSKSKVELTSMQEKLKQVNNHGYVVLQMTVNSVYGSDDRAAEYLNVNRLKRAICVFSPKGRSILLLNIASVLL